MKKFAAIFCASLFILGMLIVPVFHQAGLCFSHAPCTTAHEGEHDHEHEHDVPAPEGDHSDSDDCAICQVAATPTIASCGAMEIPSPSLAVEALVLPSLPSGSHLDAGALHARAPPFLPFI